MNMRRKLLFASVLFAAPFYASAQSAETVKSAVKEATVYFQGAEVVHTAKAQLVRGENVLVIEGLSPSIDVNSLRVKPSDGVIVTSSGFYLDYLSGTKVTEERLEELKKALDAEKEERDRLNVEISVNRNMREYLKTGTAKNVSGSESGLGIDELKKTMDYYKAKSLELENQAIVFDRKLAELNERIGRLQTQYNQESRGTKNTGTVRLVLSSPRTGDVDFIITYYTERAQWVPVYDINVASSDKSARISSKSVVSQTTGLDWDKIKLTLSTAVPSRGGEIPLFSTWFLRQTQLNDFHSALEGRMAGVAVQNKVSYDEVVVTGMASPGSVKVRGVTSLQTEAQPLYVVNGEVVSEEYFASIDVDMIKNMEVLKDESAVAIYGSRASGGVIAITLKSASDFVAAQENELNTVYALDMLYSIPGNGKVQNIELLTMETAAEQKYYTAPKLAAETYLIAEIANWQNLGLLSGKANVTYDGTFIGETKIDASSTHAKLTLTLGTDTRIAVKREKVQDFSSARTIGNDILQTFTYRITVKNNQTKPVKVVVKDQYPVSTRKDVEVALRTKETTPWAANVDALGIITWEEELAPGQTKTYDMSYSVKYPKYLDLNL